MRLRLFAILVLVLLLNVVLAGSPLTIHSQPSVSLVCLSPPERLELPVGQGVEVLCRLQGTAQGASVAFRVNGVPLYVEDVLTDGFVRW
jgi:hypothetical protein